MQSSIACQGQNSHYFLQVYDGALQGFSLHSVPTGARNSSLGHPNMAEASLGKNFPKVIPSLLNVFNWWYLQSLVIWCVSLSRPQNFWGKRRHLARRGGDISSMDARISTCGCPKLQRLEKPGCPKLRKDARIWIKMPESRLTIRMRDHWFNTLRWRHNGRDSVSNHQPHGCLLNRLFRRRSKKTSKRRVTGLCVGNWPGTGEFPAQMASNAENVSIWWRHQLCCFISDGEDDYTSKEANAQWCS